MLTRRRFLMALAASGAVFVIPRQTQHVAASFASAQPARLRPPRGRIPLPQTPLPGGTLNPTTIPQYVTPLVIPPAMPQAATPPPGLPPGVDYYEIAVRQFSQHILPAPLPATTVWSYGSADNPTTFNYPAFTIEAAYNRPVRVRWLNELVDQNGHYLPHLLPVDPTLHWANPPGGLTGRDARPIFTATPGPYTGPTPLVTHVHGAHTTQESDGYAEAWYLPAADDIPAGYATTGTFYDKFKLSSPLGSEWTANSVVFEYPNNQRATTLWYHDHTLGMTRLNVYAGPAGFYLLRGGPDDAVTGVLPGPAPTLGDTPGTRCYEIPLAIQDRSFNADGSLFFPDSRAFFDGITGPYVPESDVAPIWNPEFFGNTMVVNGNTWPMLDVEARRYRFRILNGCNARALILQLADNPVDQMGVIPPAALSFHQIGAEGGFLPAPVTLDRLLLAPAERADVIIDFTGLTPGTELLLINLGPDAPFGGGAPGVDFQPADGGTTGQVLKFNIIAPVGADLSTPVDQLQLPAITPLAPADRTRRVSLNEMETMHPGLMGPIVAALGSVTDGPMGAQGIPLMWHEPITENVRVGDTEIWEIYNFTEDAHPIHLHLVQFEVVNRQPVIGGPARGPEPWETGFKDTVIAYPHEITRIKAHFDTPGRFVWHCHIVDHEDNEMMRPFTVSHQNHMMLIYG